jgi:hypothetical protein
MEPILVVNAGSSSLKLQVFALGALSAIRFPCCRAGIGQRERCTTTLCFMNRAVTERLGAKHMQTVSLENSVAMIPDGASLMIGGFMAVGTSERVVVEIVRQNKRDLIGTDAGAGHVRWLRPFAVPRIRTWGRHPWYPWCHDRPTLMSH